MYLARLIPVPVITPLSDGVITTGGYLPERGSITTVIGLGLRSFIRSYHIAIEPL